MLIKNQTSKHQFLVEKILRTTKFTLSVINTQRLLEIVQTELVQAAVLAGRPTLKSIDKTAVKTNFV